MEGKRVFFVAHLQALWTLYMSNESHAVWMDSDSVVLKWISMDYSDYSTSFHGDWHHVNIPRVVATQILFIFNPTVWGSGIQFDLRIFFQMGGWLNHQRVSLTGGHGKNSWCNKKNHALKYIDISNQSHIIMLNIPQISPNQLKELHPKWWFGKMHLNLKNIAIFGEFYVQFQGSNGFFRFA